MSSVPKFGACVITCTWLLVISGTASIGTLVILQIPAPTMVSVSKPIMNLLLIEKSMILLIIRLWY